jgi:hypothetical protein
MPSLEELMNAARNVQEQMARAQEEAASEKAEEEALRDEALSALVQRNYEAAHEATAQLSAVSARRRRVVGVAPTGMHLFVESLLRGSVPNGATALKWFLACLLVAGA